MITAQRHGFSGRASRVPPPEEASNDWTVAHQTACLQEHPTAANPRAMLRAFLTVTRHLCALLGCPKVESIRPRLPSKSGQALSGRCPRHPSPRPTGNLASSRAVRCTCAATSISTRSSLISLAHDQSHVARAALPQCAYVTEHDNLLRLRSPSKGS